MSTPDDQDTGREATAARGYDTCTVCFVGRHNRCDGEANIHHVGGSVEVVPCVCTHCEFCGEPAPADQFHPYWHDEGAPMRSCDDCISDATESACNPDVAAAQIAATPTPAAASTEEDDRG